MTVGLTINMTPQIKNQNQKMNWWLPMGMTFVRRKDLPELEDAADMGTTFFNNISRYSIRMLFNAMIYFLR